MGIAIDIVNEITSKLILTAFIHIFIRPLFLSQISFAIFVIDSDQIAIVEYSI